MATIAEQTSIGGKSLISAFAMNTANDAPDSTTPEYKYDALKDGQTTQTDSGIITQLAWQNFRYDSDTETYVSAFDVTSEPNVVTGNIEDGNKIEKTTGGSTTDTLLIWYMMDTHNDKVAVKCLYGNYIAPFGTFSAALSSGEFTAIQGTFKAKSNTNDITIPIAAFDTSKVTAPAADVVIPAGKGVVTTFLDPA